MEDDMGQVVLKFAFKKRGQPDPFRIVMYLANDIVNSSHLDGLIRRKIEEEVKWHNKHCKEGVGKTPDEALCYYSPDGEALEPRPLPEYVRSIVQGEW